MFFKI
jgi:hypothetical protein